MPRVLPIIRQRLHAGIAPIDVLEIEDVSSRHIGHAGSREGGETHFVITIVSNAFLGKTPMARHRWIYTLLDHEMKTDIHALSIHAYTPEEFSKI